MATSTRDYETFNFHMGLALRKMCKEADVWKPALIGQGAPRRIKEKGAERFEPWSDRQVYDMTGGRTALGVDIIVSAARLLRRDAADVVIEMVERVRTGNIDGFTERPGGRTAVG